MGIEVGFRKTDSFEDSFSKYPGEGGEEVEWKRGQIIGGDLIQWQPRAVQ